MSIRAIWKICPKCHKRYEWNPDVGILVCPYCHGVGKRKQKKLDEFLKKGR